MNYKYCFVDSENKFVASYENSELTEKEKENAIFTIPPKLNDNLIAFWKNNSWYVRRKKSTDNLNRELLEKLEFEKLKKTFLINNTLIEQRTGNLVSTSEMLNKLESEKARYINIVTDLYEKDIEIPEIIKTYMNDIKMNIEKYKNIPSVFTKYRYYDTDESVEDDILDDVLENKFEAEYTIKNLNA